MSGSDPTAQPPFWLVWSETGFPPRYKHVSQHAAETEAERLARKNPGSCFVVLAPTARFTAERLKIERFDAGLFDYDDGVPF